MENLEEKLKEIGLNEKEAKVYSALLKSSRGTAYGIAKKAGVKTPTTYLILEALIDKGLALKIPYSKSTIFVAKMPDEYLEKRKSRLLSFENFLPQLKNDYRQNSLSKTITFEGYDGIKDALNYSFEEVKGKKIFAFFSHLPKADPKILEIYFKWHAKADKHGIVYKTIIPDAKESMLFIKKQEEIYKNKAKLIPTNLWSPETSIEIIENSFVRIISSKDLQATIIENTRVAKAMKQIFNMIWNSNLGRDYK